MGLIYKHTNKITLDAYIGKTICTMEKRLKTHISESINGETHFQRAIRKYGIENFISDILEDDINEENINEREIYWIEFYDTYLGKGYNMTRGGDGGDTRINFSKNEKMKFAEKISKANKGKVLSAETKKKISEAKLKNPTRNVGGNNGRAKKFIIMFPNGKEIVTEEGWMKIFEEYNIPLSLRNHLNEGKIINSNNGNLDGYELKDFEKQSEDLGILDFKKRRYNGKEKSYKITFSNGDSEILMNTTLKEVCKEYNLLYSTAKKYIGKEMPEIYPQSRNKTIQRENCIGVIIIRF